MRLRMVACILAVAVAGCHCGLARSATAADVKETARKVAESASKCVVTVRVVCSLKLNMQGQNMDQEQKNEIPGTVIDPSGLTVASATALDPSAMLKRMFAGMKIDTAIKDTTLILADGTEVPAEVVMKDTDLDMAFVRPKEAGKTFDAVPLKPRAAQAKVLDDVFVVGRMGKEGNRTHTVELGIIRAQVKGPRTFYVCSAEVSGNPGCIVYTADGEPLGVVVTKVAMEGHGGEGNAEDGGLGAMLSMSSRMEGGLTIVRPVEDLIDAAKQAKEAKKKGDAK